MMDTQWIFFMERLKKKNPLWYYKYFGQWGFGKEEEYNFSKNYKLISTKKGNTY